MLELFAPRATIKMIGVIWNQEAGFVQPQQPQLHDF